MPKYLFLDTPVYLHYKPIVELGLDKQYGKDCVLILPRVILGELNEHKDSHKSPKIQKRARSICKKIRQWDKSGQVTSAIQFQFVVATSDPNKHGLNPDCNDDRFLADILLFQAPPEDKVLITTDVNMLITAGKFGIQIGGIDESLKLPSEPDPLEKENRELRQKLQRIKNAMPDLKVGLVALDSDKDVDTNPVFQIEKPDIISDVDIENELAEKQKLWSKLKAIPREMGIGPYSIPQDEVDRFKREIEEHPSLYRQYLYDLQKHKETCSISFRIVIQNAGSAPAEDIDMYLYFPDGFNMYLEDNVPKCPQKPDSPRTPLTLQEQLIQRAQGFQYTPIHLVSPKMPASYSLKKTNSYKFTDSFEQIKHNEQILLPELFLSFPSYKQVKSFQCRYYLTVANLPNAVEGVINFQVEKELPSEDGTDKD